jgi:hypothetical protein
LFLGILNEGAYGCESTPFPRDVNGRYAVKYNEHVVAINKTSGFARSHSPQNRLLAMHGTAMGHGRTLAEELPVVHGELAQMPEAAVECDLSDRALRRFRR